MTAPRTIDPDFLELCPDVITVEPRTGLDEWNVPQYGTPYTVQARIDAKPRMVRNKEGREVVSSALIILYQVYNVTPGDRITLPNRAPEYAQPPILHVNTAEDQFGTYLVEIYV
jgi:hypothetical protein